MKGAMKRPVLENRQKVIQVKYIHQYNVIELTYDKYKAIGCLAQVENPNARRWHEKIKYPKFYILPCPKSMRNDHLSDIFASKREDECQLLPNSKTYSMVSHRICGDCLNELVSQSSGSLDCYCVALKGRPESNHTKKLKDKPLKQVELSKKHKEEKDRLENQVQERRKKLVEKQRIEVDLATVKAEIVNAEEEGREKGREEYVQRISKLEEKLKDFEEDVDAGHDLVSQLTISHRQAKDEVEDARTTILNSRMLQKYGTNKIGVKVLGQINTDGWWEECKDKFRSNQEAFGTWQSQVDELLRKQTFNPIKVVPDDKGGHKNVIDEDDEELTKLRKSYGPLVANAVGVAALEIATWNPSGRYNISMPWDFNAGQKATMSQIFQLFVDVLQEKEKEMKGKDMQLKALIQRRPPLRHQRGGGVEHNTKYVRGEAKHCMVLFPYEFLPSIQRFCYMLCNTFGYLCWSVSYGHLQYLVLVCFWQYACRTFCGIICCRSCLVCGLFCSYVLVDFLSN